MIIFDLDGTLWDTTIATFSASKNIAKKYKIDKVSKEQVVRGMGLTFIENAINYFPNYDIEKAKKYLIEMNNECQKIISLNNVTIYEGTKKIIKELSKEFKLGIITNNSNEYINTFFKITGLQDYFSDYIGTSNYGISKGEAITLMLKRNNETNAIYVGDTLNDKKQTQIANQKFIYAKYGFGKIEDYDYVINNIHELPKIIKKLGGIKNE